MTREESIAILRDVYNQMSAMPDSDLFKYLYSNSETFRKVVDCPYSLFNDNQNDIFIEADINLCSNSYLNVDFSKSTITEDELCLLVA